MKNGVFWMISLILFLIPFSCAANYVCSDNSTIVSDFEEINERNMQSVAGLKLGICESSESSIHKWVESAILIDSNIVTLENSSATPGLELKSSNATIQYTEISNDKVTIALGGSTEELELWDCSSLGGFTVMVKEIDNPEVKVLVGNTKELLNTQQNNSKIVTVNGKNYAVTLIGGSSASSTVRVNWCRTGDLVEVATTITETIENNSSNSQINESGALMQVPEIIECPNIGLRNETRYCNAAGKYINQSAQGDACIDNYECISNFCKKNLCEKRSVFNRFINWIKNIF